MADKKENPFKIISKSHGGYALLCLVILAADQISKHLMLRFLKAPPHTIEILPFFNLTLAWNRGVSFSMFATSGELGRYLLSAVSALISLILLFWYLRESNKLVSTGLIMVIAGAIGNLIDRLIYGAVIDFIHIFYQSFSWPVFNIADTFITIGVGLILIDTFINREDKNLES